MSAHEGEVILKEKYGTSSRLRLYVKPPDQSSIVVLDVKQSSSVLGWFTRVFLPQGYPDSVSKDYLAYQIWDTAQAFCSTITGTLATQEVLRGVGVGDTAATPLSATLTWVLKDSCGHLGRILFAFTHGTSLDAYSKKWRLYADTLNDAAMLIEIALPLFKNYITFALCVSTTMKAIVGVAGGATRAAMTQHHAVRGNMADVAAKDSAQETAVNLVASLVAVLLISLFGSSLILFLSIMVLHITFNYLAVRAVCLRTLNEPRFLVVIHSYLKHEVVPAPCFANTNEPIIFYQLGSNLLDLKICGFHILSGYSLKQLTSENITAEHLSSITHIYAKREYILFPCVENRLMYLLIKENADVNGVLCAYFHAVLLATMVCAINNIPLTVYKATDGPRPFAVICDLISNEDWSRELIVPTPTGLMYKPTLGLMQYVDKMVTKEWLRLRNGLIRTEYDLSKHLIMCDEWRISSHTVASADTGIEKHVESYISSPAPFSPFDSALDEIVRDELFPENYTVEPTDTASQTTLPAIIEKRELRRKSQYKEYLFGNASKSSLAKSFDEHTETKEHEEHTDNKQHSS